MRRLLGLAFFATLILLLPQAARAQRGRNGPIQTPWGPEQNITQSAEWRQAGGNMEVYQQIMYQKYMAAQQKEMDKVYQANVKQQQAFQKWVKDQAAKKAKGQPTDPAYDRMVAYEEQQQKAMDAQAAKAAARAAAKKKPAKKAATKSTTKSDDAASADTATTKKTDAEKPKK